MNHLVTGMAFWWLLAFNGLDNPTLISPVHETGIGGFNHLERDGIQNLYALSGRVFSGAAPAGERGFASLKDLGIKTIISVDGIQPDTDLASKYDLRYVHIPVSYDGIAHSNVLMLIKAAQTSSGLVFVHCHHGMHRGPAAAAIVCEGLEQWTPLQAEAWLHTAGTSTNYPGLYRVVREFRPLSENDLRAVPVNFPSHARTRDLVNMMIQIDHHFDVLKALQTAAFITPPEQPEATAASESLILLELFREARRTGQGAERGDGFLAALGAAESSAAGLHACLTNLADRASTVLPAANRCFKKLSDNCTTCHEAYRN